MIPFEKNFQKKKYWTFRYQMTEHTNNMGKDAKSGTWLSCWMNVKNTNTAQWGEGKKEMSGRGSESPDNAGAVSHPRNDRGRYAQIRLSQGQPGYCAKEHWGARTASGRLIRRNFIIFAYLLQHYTGEKKSKTHQYCLIVLAKLCYPRILCGHKKK